MKDDSSALERWSHRDGLKWLGEIKPKIIHRDSAILCIFLLSLKIISYPMFL